MLFVLMSMSNGLLMAQLNQQRDSLLQELRKAKPDTNKVWMYIKLGQQYETNDPDSALRLYESALHLSEELNYTRGKISYYTNATYVYNVKGRYDTALTLNLKSVELAKEFGDPERLSACLGNVAGSYTMLDQSEKAIDIYLQVLPLFEKLPKSTNYAVTNENLSVLYNEIKQYEKAKRHGLIAIDTYRELKHEAGLANALNNLAVVCIDIAQYDEAATLLAECESIARRTNNQLMLMSTALNQSSIAIYLGNYEGLKKNCETALTYARKFGDKISEVIALRGLAIYYFNIDKPVEAERYARESLDLALRVDAVKHIGKAYSVLAEIAILRKDFRANTKYSIKSDSIRDELLNESVASNVQMIEARYEAEKREQRIRELQQEGEIKDLSLERNKLFNVVLIGSLITLVLIGLLARYNYQQKRILLTKENQLKEVHIARLESEKQLLAGEAVIKGQEEERGRLAKDLHDGLGGMLSGVKFSLANMKSNVVLDADSTLVFERSLDMLDHSITELRRVAHNMMPEVLVRFGLSEALRSYCDTLRTSKLFRIDYQSVGTLERLPEKTEIFIFRIVQELLNNVVKHANATQVLVQLSCHENEVSVTVEDNGGGFDVGTERKSRGAGLESVRSRVEYLKGKLDIQSRPGQGTSVYVTVHV